MRSAIVDTPIDLGALVHSVSAPAAGATLLFLGTVRDVNDGRAVTGIEYSTYRAMAERELSDIVAETAVRFATEGIAVEHRVGTLNIEEISVAIAVSHARRSEAYAASRYVIEELKRRLPVWKLELYADGTREWVGIVDRGTGLGTADIR
jgi:molybdopterin synthase catalytic subunit